MPNLVTTDSYADYQRYRVAKRRDGQYAVYDTECGRTVSVHKWELDAVAEAAQANDEEDE